MKYLQDEIKHWEDNLELTEGLEIRSVITARTIITNYLKLLHDEKIPAWVSKQGREAIEWRMEKIKKYRAYLNKTLNETR